MITEIHPLQLSCHAVILSSHFGQFAFANHSEWMASWVTYLEDCRDQIGLHVYRIHGALIGQWCPTQSNWCWESGVEQRLNVRWSKCQNSSIEQLFCVKYRKCRSEWWIIENIYFPLTGDSVFWEIIHALCLLLPWYPPFFTLSLLFNLLLSLLFKAKAYTCQI